MAAADLGGPVALKAEVPGLVHKAEAGAVLLGLDGPGAVRPGSPPWPGGSRATSPARWSSP